MTERVGKAVTSRSRRAPPLPSPPVPKPRKRSGFEFVVPILIGLVTLAGALLAWKASSLESEASGIDRRAVLEEARVQEIETQAEDDLRAAYSAYARFRGEKTSEEALLEAAEEARRRGDSSAARELTEEAREFGALTEVLSDTGGFAGYAPEEPGARLNDEGLLRDRRRDLEPKPPNPQSSAELADDAHRRSDRTVAWIVVLAVSLLVLTAAQFVQQSSVRAALAWVGGLIFAVGTVGGAAT